MGLTGKTSLLVEVQEVTEPKESFLPPDQGHIIPQSAWELTEISQARRTSQILAASSLLHSILPILPAEGSLLTFWVHSAQSYPLPEQGYSPCTDME